MSRLFRSSLAALLLAATAAPASALPARGGDPADQFLDAARRSSTPWTLVPGPGPSDPAGTTTNSPQGFLFPSREIEVGAAGDVDANGAGDWLVGTPDFSPSAGLEGAGRVTVYRRDSAGILDALTIDGPAQYARFGASVAPAGDVNGDGYDDVVIGAPNLGGDIGRVYIYKGGPGGLLAQSPWILEGSGFQYFGYSVSYAGDVNGDGYDDILVGAPASSSALPGEGAAYCYLGGPLGPATIPARTWVGDASLEFLGQAVAGGGDVNADGYADVLVGSPGWSNGEASEGRARLFLGGPGGPSGTSAWSYEPNVAEDHAGAVLAFPGDMDGDGFAEFALGIPDADANSTNDGRMLVFGGSPFVFFSPQVFEQTGGNLDARFGYDVAPAGDLNGDGFADLVMGAPDGAGSGGGLWYMLYGSPDMAAVNSSLADFGPPGWQAGLSVSGVGDDGDGKAHLLIGVVVPPDPTLVDAPAAVQGLPVGPGAILTGGVTFDQLGYFPRRPFAQGNFGETTFGISAVMMDINGDGYDDAIVGGPNYDGKLGMEGVVRAYYGGADGLAGDPILFSRGGEKDAVAAGVPGSTYNTPDWTFTGPMANSNFGFSLANAGDVNGDGYEDLLVGAPTATVDFNLEGAAYLFYGGPDGPGTQPDWHAEGLAEFMFHGYHVAGAGDVNQDGYADFLIGAPLASPGGVAQAGQVALHYGSSIGPSHVPARVWTGSNEAANMGTGSCGAGDVDNDGYPDVLINEPGYANGQTNEGRFRIYLGGASGLEANPFFDYEANVPEQLLGFTCAPAGDTNCDGFADVLIGSYQFTDTQPAEGAVLVFTGGPGGMFLASTLAPGIAGAGFGTSVSTGGDLNKDGCSEILIGAPDQPFVLNARGAIAGTDGGAAPAADTRTAAERLLSPGPAAPAGVPANGVVYLYFGNPTGIDAGLPRTFEEFDQGAWGRAVAGGGDLNGDGWADFIYTAPYADGAAGIDNGIVTLAFSNVVTSGAARPDRLLLTDASAPIAHGGRSNAPSSFRVSGLGRHPMGRGKGRMQWQAKAAGAAFDGTGIQSSSVLRTGVPSPGLGSTITYGGLATGLTTGQRYRVRTRYTTRNPYAPRTRWFTSERDGIEQSDLRTFGPTGAVAVEEPAGAPRTLSFAGPWPNPLAGTGTLSFTLPGAGRVTIDAYDASGKRVARVHDGEAAAGPSTVTWDGRDDAGRTLPRGLYFLRLTAGHEEKTVKAVLSR